MDFSLQDLWWLKPKEPDNPLPAMQLGAQIVQHRARVDLQQAEAANDIARTSLMRTETMAKLQLQTRIDASNAELAGLASQITDFSDPAQMKPIYDLGSRAGWIVGTKGWEGIINTHERAVTAQRLGEEASSRIAAMEDRAEYNEKRLQLQELLARSDIAFDGARILKLKEEVDMMGRELAVREGNLRLRGIELGQKGKRLSLRDAATFKNELKFLDNEEKVALARPLLSSDETSRLRKLYNLKRRDLVEKIYGPQPAETEQALTPDTGRISIISPDGKPGTIPASQLEEALKAGYKTTAPDAPSTAPDNTARAEEVRNSYKAGKLTKEQALQQLRELGFK